MNLHTGAKALTYEFGWGGVEHKHLVIARNLKNKYDFPRRSEDSGQKVKVAGLVFRVKEP
jgi:hypothetical protein